MTMHVSFVNHNPFVAQLTELPENYLPTKKDNIFTMTKFKIFIISLPTCLMITERNYKKDTKNEDQ